MILNEHYDVIIVGAGITGCYLSRRLNNLNPSLKILILEKSNTYGGRLVSIPWGGIIAEMGAWRFSPTRDILITNLILKLGLTSIPLNLPRIKEPPPVPEILNIIDKMPPNIDTIAFIPYLYSQGASTKEILGYIDYLGYDIYRGNIEAALIREPDDGYAYIKEGYKSLCTKLIQQMNNSVHLLLGTRVSSVSRNMVVLQDNIKISTKNLIVTVLPQHLSLIYPTVSNIIYSSMIAYNAIRLLCKIDKDIQIGTYVFDAPIRKLYALGNRVILIYVDGAYAGIVSQLLGLIPSLIGASVIYNPKPIYKYWLPGIMFWKPRGLLAIESMIRNLPFTYMNGDVSDRPGWVEGSLLLVDKYMKSIM